MSIARLPSIYLVFYTHVNMRLWELGEQLLSVIYTQGPMISPEKVDYGKDWKSIDSENFHFLAKEWKKQWSIVFRREKNMNLRLL
jgi:hypothetical protein